MKQLSVIFISLVILAACNNEEGKNDQPVPGTPATGAATTIDSANFTTVQWLDSLKDLGSIKKGEQVNIVFRFKNTGDKPLLVQNVMAGCGCTIPERTEEPVLPSKEGFIKAMFNSTNQHGTVHKTIEVQMNTKPSTAHTIAFIGDVTEK